MSASVSGTNSNYWVNPTRVDNGSSSAGTDNMGTADTFLKLLATELQYQDPTQPVSNTEYVAQLAQFNSLQQLSAMNNSMSEYQAYSLIGKNVYYTTTDAAGNTVNGSGAVDSIITQNNTVYLMVGENRAKLSSVVRVENPAVAAASTTSSGTTASAIGTSAATGTGTTTG